MTAFILTYRVGPKARLPIPFADGARAIRFVRANAEAFGVDSKRIGMMDFSAGRDPIRHLGGRCRQQPKERFTNDLCRNGPFHLVV